MRLALFERLGWFPRLFIRFIGWMSRSPPPDILPVLFYKRSFFGDSFSHAVDVLLRGPSEWTVAERELMAAHVSRLNRCPFCAISHAGVAKVASDPAWVDAVLAEPEAAATSPKLASALALIGRLTLSADAVTPEDFRRCRQAGVSDHAILDAVALCSFFCMINRVANALDFAPLPEDHRFSGYRQLLRRGYRYPGSPYPPADRG